MKVFLTGATGFIGINLKKHFESHGHEVYCYYRSGLIDLELKSAQPNLIINCAAEIYNRDLMWSSNVELVRSCLEYVKQNPKTTLLQLGSSSEYGPVDRASTEQDPIRAVDMYATTKGIATHLCQGYAQSYGLDVVIARLYSPFGPGERPHRLFPRLWQAFELDRAMNLVDGVHDFSYIDDVVSAIDCILQSSVRTPGEIVNICSGQGITNWTILELFEEYYDRRGAVTFDKDTWATPPVWCGDNSVLINRYGWQPKYNLQQGIEKFIETAKYE